MRAALRTRWVRLPVWARWVLACYLVGFADGTGDHIRWMTHGGIHAYADAYPAVPIQLLFVALVALDPLVVVLAGLVRRSGVWLAVAVMVLDMIANWYGNWSRITTEPGHELSTAPWLITAFGLFVFATAVPLLRTMAARLGGAATALGQPGRPA